MSFEHLFKNFENVDEALKCTRIGDVPPPYLTGTLLRNGPGKFSYENSEVRHWFDGLAYMQRFHFNDGELEYSAKFLDSEAYKLCEKEQRFCVSLFGTHRYSDPCKTLYGRLQSFFQKDVGADNCLVNFVQLADSVYALTETPYVIKVDPETLQAESTDHLAKYVSIASATAHPHALPDGTLINSGHLYGKEYVFIRTSPETGGFEKTSVVARIPYADKWHPGYHHSFGMTENYIALFESPVRVRLLQLLMRWAAGRRFSLQQCDLLRVPGVPDLAGRHADEHHRRAPGHGRTAGRQDQRAAVLHLPPRQLVRAGRLPRAGLLLDAESGHVRGAADVPDAGRLVQCTGQGQSTLLPSPGRTNVCTRRRSAGHQSRRGQALRQRRHRRAAGRRLDSLHARAALLLVYNYERHNARAYSFVYGSTLLFNPADDELAGIVKLDVTTGDHLTWRRDFKEQLCGEPVFVPDPSGTGEDDGVLLVPVMTISEHDQPIFLVLRARDLKEICRYVIPIDHLPPSFHATYLH